MPKAVIKSVDVNERSEVAVVYDVFRDDGSLWEQLWLSLPLDEYSAAEVDRRIRIALNRCKRIEMAKANPATEIKTQIQAEWANKEIVL